MKIDRFREVVYEGLFCDILWSDPNPNFRNKLKVVIRGHEVQEEGYALLDEYNNHPTIHTMNKMPQATNNEQTLEGNFPEISEELNASLPDKNYEYPINEKLEGTLKNSSMETSETMVEKIVETLENQYNEVFAKNMVLLRTERECIDELEDDDSTLDCCSLRNKSSRDIEFEEASEKDRVNEEAQVLDDTSASRLSSIMEKKKRFIQIKMDI
ncbi:unnamed protein product [Medioppia subpectinata]|uniref:Uncharacterized protein n=1 Tax=Medioppia subpectinata TaxID=1979941 RepID=A0A7R9KD64_9ACAR|nr:unnamed protein product [Medioppia subpectinata]CAG2099931.1 unnamed protein product [Medioppia subpectinata]